MKKIIRVGTRGSPLALIQAQIVRDRLYKAHEKTRDRFEIEIVPIRTSGDWSPGQGEKSFQELGGTKGLFTKEIEEALLAGTIDCAVHSMKDVSVHEHDSLSYHAMIQREDPRDALLSPLAPRLEDMPAGARIGTSSLRRKAQILAFRPDLNVLPLRGNVDTRLKKLAAEEVDATILAVAGLSRLDRMERIASIMDTKIMLPAGAQGILGIQIRCDDEAMSAFVRPVHHEMTGLCCLAERAFLRALDGSCRTPIGVLALERHGKLHVTGMVAKPDGSSLLRDEMTGSLSDPEKIGYDLADRIRTKLPEGFFCL